MFENAINSTRQGDIGEARAIYEYTKLGYVVSRTLFDSAKYDLIVEKDGILQTVQVKTTKAKRGDSYVVDLRSTGGNKSGNTSKVRSDKDYQILFVLSEGGRCWSIEINDSTPKSSINLGDKYKKYELNTE